VALSGWNLVLHCPQCGIRAKAVDDLLQVVGFATEVSKVVSKMTCSKCHRPPTSVEAEMKWANKYGSYLPREDLSHLLPGEIEAAA
jgi:hypothetical protein